MFIRVLESADSLEQSAKNLCASWDTYLFLSCKCKPRPTRLQCTSITKKYLICFQYFYLNL